MKLTESKLKQMINEVLRDKRFQDFGIPTPDEKLKAELGDEMFDKIQSADPEQAEMFKQSFDPNYPRDIKQESLDAILEPAGFKLYKWNYKLPVLHKGYNARTWPKEDPVNFDLLEFKTTYHLNADRSKLFYSIEMKTKKGYHQRTELIARDKIQAPKLFDLSMETEEKLRDVDALVLSREKGAIEKALEQYK